MDTEIQGLQEKYDKLLNDYLKLNNEYDTLKYAYSENTIIESMNDMKVVYENQQHQIKKLKEIINNISDINKSIQVMLSILNTNTSSYNYEGRYELKCRIEFIEEVLKTSLKLKNKLYYLDYDDE